MYKHVFAIALALTLALPAWAAIGEKAEWMDNIPGLTLLEARERADEVERSYRMDKPIEAYKALEKELQKQNWQVVRRQANDDAPDMPKLMLSKNGYILEIDIDYHKRQGYYELEVEVEPADEL